MTRPPFFKTGVRAELKRAMRFDRRSLLHLWRAAVALAGHLIAGVVALVVVFEEWGWRPLADLLGKLARYSPVAWIENRIRLLPPYAALAIFALPTVSLFPLKLLALYLVAQGKTVMAAALFAGAKVVGTALIARLYMLTEHALMRIGWFKRAYDFLMPYKNALVEWVHDSRAWRYGRIVKWRVMNVIRPISAAVRSRLAALFRRSNRSADSKS